MGILTGYPRTSSDAEQWFVVSWLVRGFRMLLLTLWKRFVEFYIFSSCTEYNTENWETGRG
jgi:hypothetical protein